MSDPVVFIVPVGVYPLASGWCLNFAYDKIYLGWIPTRRSLRFLFRVQELNSWKGFEMDVDCGVVILKQWVVVYLLTKEE